MHRCDTAERVKVVHHREHTLLHLTAVPRVDDHLLSARQVEDYSRLRVEAEFLVVFYLRLRSIVNDEIRLKRLKFFFCRTNEHIRYEVCLPSYFHNEANAKARSGVCTAVAIHYEEALVRKLFLGQIFQYSPRFRSSRLVIIRIFGRIPPNRIFAGFVLNNKLIFRRTARINAGENVYSAEF